MTSLSRRAFVGGAAGAALLPSRVSAAPARVVPRRSAGEPQLYFAVKYGMVQVSGSMTERFQLLQRLGFDGVELDSPNSYPEGSVAAARAATGLPVHGLVNSRHWQDTLSSSDESVRAKGVSILEGALRHSHAYGGSSVLLVPGKGGDGTREEVWERSLAGIRAVLPLAAKLGVHILIENVWNRFLYDHEGGADQTAQQLVDYIDAANSPWVGAYFDIGNHQKYGRPADWIRALGKRIVKLDVKDWGRQSSWAAIGDGDVDWEDVRAALAEIGYHGWATAEVSGGGEERLADILARMQVALRGT